MVRGPRGKPISQKTRRAIVTQYIPIAQPIYSSLPQQGPMGKFQLYATGVIDSGSEPSNCYAIDEYVLIEPLYIPARLKIVELSEADKAKLSLAAKFDWDDASFDFFSRAIERTILSITYDDQTPGARGLRDKLLKIENACELLFSALTCLDERKKFDNAVLEDNEVIRHFLSPKIDVVDLVEKLEVLRAQCLVRMKQLESSVTAPGRKKDMAFDALLNDVISAFKHHHLSTKVPFNEIGRKPTPLSAFAKEISRIVTVEGLRYVDDLMSKNSIKSSRRTQAKMRAFKTRTDQALGKALRSAIESWSRSRLNKAQPGMWVRSKMGWEAK